MRKVIAISLLAVLLLAACDTDKAKELANAATPCDSPEAALTTAPTLPSAFPTPTGVVYTASAKTGPSTSIDAYFAGDLTDLFNNYKSGFTSAGGYNLTKTENDGPDAEVDWSGHSTTGEVKLGAECTGRTSITITVRPA